MEELSMQEGVVDLSIPAQASAMVLARLQVSGVGRLLGFDVDELSDLRLAVEELCLDGLARSRPEDRLRIEISWDDTGVKVCCGVERHGGPVSAVEPAPRLVLAPEISTQILGALIDEQGVETVDGVVREWIRKKRTPR
jgi:hypothetical protein